MSGTGDYERYLGGFYSIQLMIGPGRKAILGYGTYFTNARFIGLGQGQRPSFDKQIPLIPQNLSREENDRIINELHQRKSLELTKDTILRIELKMPPWRFFRQGNLQIMQTKGEPVSFGTWYGKEELKTLYFGRTRPAEQLRDLFRIFDPEALVVS